MNGKCTRVTLVPKNQKIMSIRRIMTQTMKLRIAEIFLVNPDTMYQERYSLF